MILKNYSRFANSAQVPHRGDCSSRTNLPVQIELTKRFRPGVIANRGRSVQNPCLRGWRLRSLRLRRWRLGRRWKDWLRRRQFFVEAVAAVRRCGDAVEQILEVMPSRRVRRCFAQPLLLDIPDG